MARTNLTVKILPESAPIADLFTGATAVDSVNGMQWTYNGGRRKLVVNNGSGASIDVTTKSNATADGLTVPDRVTTVAAGKTAIIREAPTARQADGTVHVDFSASATVTAVVVEDS